MIGLTGLLLNKALVHEWWWEVSIGLNIQLVGCSSLDWEKEPRDRKLAYAIIINKNTSLMN
jgi:hypothetical protein